MKSFTSFPNDCLEVLIATDDITRAECQVVLAVIRLTFGYHVQQAPISIGRLEEETGLPRRTVTRCLDSLQEKNVVSLTGYEMIEKQKVSVREVPHPSTWKVGTAKSLQVGTVQSLPSAEGRERGDQKVGTIRSPIKEKNLGIRRFLRLL